MTAGRRGRKVTLLEKNPELGKKIRISGGGRCNFTNISDTLDVAYHSSRSSSNEAAFFEKAFARYPPEKFIGLVESHGIKYHEKKLGQLFCNKSAQQIVDMLQEECLAAKVDLRTGAEVCGVTREGQEYRVDYQQAGEAKELRAQAVLVATGGLSFARTCGSTDLAHRLAEAFQLKVSGLRPGLVPLLLPKDAAWTRSLTGVSLEVRASMCGGASFVERILFTHRGLSGPAVLQASSYWQQTEDALLCLDLLPCMDEVAVIEWLSGRAAAAGRRRRPMFASEDLARKLPRRFAEQFWRQEACRQLGADQDAGVQDLSAAKLRRLAALLKRWEVTVVGTEGYPKAEVTCGGVSTAELSDETMECKTVPGLYFIGEAVDVTGWLGGYNFQWAWASGYAAGCAC